jgi:hypothetical protein
MRQLIDFVKFRKWISSTVLWMSDAKAFVSFGQPTLLGGDQLIIFSGRSRPTKIYQISSATDTIFFIFILSITSAQPQCKYCENRWKCIILSVEDYFCWPLADRNRWFPCSELKDFIQNKFKSMDPFIMNLKLMYQHRKICIMMVSVCFLVCFPFLVSLNK